jgi:hypothetical protein
MIDRNMPEHDSTNKTSLAEFIRENSTLVTSLAAFVALTAFALQLEKTGSNFGLSAAALFGALLISLELFFKAPHRPREWRLACFELVLLALLQALGYYWFSTYRGLWVSVLLGAIPPVLAILIAVVLTYAFRWFATVVAHRFKRDISPHKLQKYSSIAFVVFMFLPISVFLWWIHRHNGVRISFHWPHW